MNINETLAKEFKLRQEQIDNTVSLIDDGKTIPFIARYRKELTGSLDDQLLREIFDRLTYLRNLEKRKEEVVPLSPCARPAVPWQESADWNLLRNLLWRRILPLTLMPRRKTT